MSINFYASLWKQVRDDEDEITMTFKVPANMFEKVIGIPTRTTLLVQVDLAEQKAQPAADGGEQGES